MKKVTAFIGSARKKYTYDAVREFFDDLEALGGVECEIVALCDYRVETCRGCKLCFEKGEEFCPLKDDRDALIEKIIASDGVVFASPNYSFQVSGIMKIFLDRLGFVFHRPRFHGKTYTSIVVQGVYGGRRIVKYLDFVGGGLGFDVVKGSCSTAFEPMTEKERGKRDKALARQSKRFYERLFDPDLRVPSLFELMAFRMARTSMSLTLDDSNLDYRYYSQHGFFESDYYYPIRLGVLKKSAGKIFDAVFTLIYKSRA
ncbi:MAG: flavodoxin family protein [Actinobacteria bacterium]|nr:flavodoxin family protein [Actinomycetota bacterium]